MTMEFRSRITVPGLSLSDEAKHERLFETLIQDFGNLGPVMTWTPEGKSTVVVLATDASDESKAAAEMVAAVSTSLHRSGLGHLYPAAIEVELVEDELVAV